MNSVDIKIPEKSGRPREAAAIADQSHRAELEMVHIAPTTKSLTAYRCSEVSCCTRT